MRPRPDAPASLALALAMTAAALPAAADTGFVTCQNGDALSVLDLVTGEERARWSVPGKPAGVAVDPEHAAAVDSKEEDAERAGRHLRGSCGVAREEEGLGAAR